MTDNQANKPVTKWFRPHVKDLNKQEAVAKENKGGIIGMFTALVAGGFAVMGGAGHIAQSVATQTPKVPPMNPTPTNATGNANLPQVDTNALKGNLKGVGRTVVRHADDIGEFYENYKSDDKEEKNATVTTVRSGRDEY